MSEIDLVHEWLSVAYNDYDTALFLFENKYPMPIEIICYHCQQSAEKSLKAFLCSNDVEIPKTHALNMLCNQCAEIENSFSEIFSDCTSLNPYATTTRYPLKIELDEIHAKKALQQASAIYTFVTTVLQRRGEK